MELAWRGKLSHARRLGQAMLGARPCPPVLLPPRSGSSFRSDAAGKPTFAPAVVAAALGWVRPSRVTERCCRSGSEADCCAWSRSGRLCRKSSSIKRLPVAHLRPDQKAELAAQRANGAVVHEGDEAPGVDGLIALYQTAWALRSETMIGVVNPVSWMCLSTDMLAETMKREFVEAVRVSPVESLALWLGFFVKLFRALERRRG